MPEQPRICGLTITDLHGTDKPPSLRHLPILGLPLSLHLRPKRFHCPLCDDHPTTQQLDWYDSKALHTKAYERHLIVLLINSTLADVGTKEDVSDDALLGILDRFELGSDSLIAIQVISRLERELRTTIPPVAVFEGATIHTLARLISPEVAEQTVYDEQQSRGEERRSRVIERRKRG